MDTYQQFTMVFPGTVNGATHVQGSIADRNRFSGLFIEDFTFPGQSGSSK